MNVVGEALMEGLDVVGLLAVELFVDEQDRIDAETKIRIAECLKNAPKAFTQRTEPAIAGSVAASSANDPPTLNPKIPSRSRSTSGRAARRSTARRMSRMFFQARHLPCATYIAKR